jgi:hypothetical protein
MNKVAAIGSEDFFKRLLTSDNPESSGNMPNGFLTMILNNTAQSHHGKFGYLH